MPNINARFVLAEEFSQLTSKTSVIGRMFDMPILRTSGVERTARDMLGELLEKDADRIDETLRNQFRKYPLPTGELDIAINKAVERAIREKASSLCLGYILGVSDIIDWSEGEETL